MTLPDHLQAWHRAGRDSARPLGNVSDKLLPSRLFQVKMEREQHQTEIRDLQDQLSEMHDELDSAKRSEDREKGALIEVWGALCWRGCTGWATEFWGISVYIWVLGAICMYICSCISGWTLYSMCWLGFLAAGTKQDFTGCRWPTLHSPTPT